MWTRTLRKGRVRYQYYTVFLCLSHVPFVIWCDHSKTHEASASLRIPCGIPTIRWAQGSVRNNLEGEQRTRILQEPAARRLSRKPRTRQQSACFAGMAQPELASHSRPAPRPWLRTEDWHVNHRRVERLWRQEGLHSGARSRSWQRHRHTATYNLCTGADASDSLLGERGWAWRKIRGRHRSWSVRAAITKSFWCRPWITCVHQFTVTFPHSVISSGW
jgi:hypothetical protein